MAFGKTGKVVHDLEVDRVESIRQSAAGAAGATQATVRTAEATFYRAALASARSTGGVDVGGILHALKTLGVSDA